MVLTEHQKQLLQLLADGRFHSGTELAMQLQVSRSAVWKQMQPLAELGLEVLAVSGKGYKLAKPLQLLDAHQIGAYLSAEAGELIGRLEIHPMLASTNTYLMDEVHRSPTSGHVCLAEYQTAGRGRRGRSWVSPFGQNIYLSLAWRYPDGPAAISGLSLAVGVAVVEALAKFGLEGAGLKWPNDIYWRGRKLAGILIEVSGEHDGPCHAVVGLGLNVAMPARCGETIEQAWTDLQQIMGEDAVLQRNRLTALLLNEMMPLVAGYQSRQLAGILQKWRVMDCMLDQAVSIYIGQQRFDGIVKGVDDQGLLLLADSDGRVRAFASGEVSFRA